MEGLFFILLLGVSFLLCGILDELIKLNDLIKDMISVSKPNISDKLYDGSVKLYNPKSPKEGAD